MSTVTIPTHGNTANAEVTTSLEFTFHINESATVIDFQRHFIQVSCSTAQGEDYSTNARQIRDTKFEANISQVLSRLTKAIGTEQPLSGKTSHVKRPERPAVPMPKAIEQDWLWPVSTSCNRIISRTTN